MKKKDPRLRSIQPRWPDSEVVFERDQDAYVLWEIAPISFGPGVVMVFGLRRRLIGGGMLN